jgi:hypothetical protein
MPDPADTLMILVEASVAIAGFSGVVVALGRHADGEWSQIERGRLVLLLNTSFSVLFLSLAALVLLHAGTEPTTTWRIGSATWSIIATYQTVLAARRALQVSRDDPELPHVAWIVTVLSLTFVIILLSLANGLAMGQFWPFLAALVWLFGLACYAFARLLLAVGQSSQGA